MQRRRKSPWSNISEIDGKYRKQDTFFGVKSQNQNFITDRKPSIIRGDRTFHYYDNASPIMEGVAYGVRARGMPFRPSENIYDPKLNDKQQEFMKKGFKTTKVANKYLFDGKEFAGQRKPSAFFTRPFQVNQKHAGFHPDERKQTIYFHNGYERLIKKHIHRTERGRL